MRTVAVIDDEPAVAKSLASILRSRGYVVEIASCGVDGIELVNRRKPDLVISDMTMPDMSGADVFHALRASPNTSHIPILIISGDAASVDAIGDARLQKPFTMADLLRSVSTLVAPCPLSN